MLIRTLLVAAIASLMTLAESSGQETLRWKLQANESVRYGILQNMETSTTFGEEEVKSSFIQAIDMTWQVLSSSAAGDTQLNQVFDRVRLKMEGGPAGTVEFDTNDRKTTNSAIVKALSDVFGNIVGQKFQVTMANAGQITDVKVPEKLLAAVKSSAAGQQGALNEKMLHDMMKQSAVILPDQPVRPGSRWTTKQTVQMPFGTMTIESSMTYVQKTGAGVAVIEFVPNVTIEPREGARTQMKLTGTDGRGQIEFDVAKGRVNKSVLDLTMQMVMDVNGQKLPQTVHNKTTMTLIP